MSIKEKNFLQVLYFGLITGLLSCLISCSKVPDATTNPEDEKAILEDANKAIHRATTGQTNIFTGEKTPDSPKGGGGGGDPLNSDTDNPHLVRDTSCQARMGTGLSAVQAATQKLSRLKVEYEALPAKPNLSDVTIQRGVVTRLEAETPEATIRERIAELEAQKAQLEKTIGDAETTLTPIMGGDTSQSRLNENRIQLERERAKLSQLETEREKLKTLETQHQQRNAKLAEIQAATRALDKLCSPS